MKKVLNNILLSKKEAKDFLQKSDWNVERALDLLYSNESIGLFDAYKESDQDIIGPEGTERLCEDLGVDPTDAVTIALSWHMKV